MRGPIPVTVLTGFLGSGKTTLVNRLLKERPQTRFGLVVNEFGEAAIESQLFETRREPLFELPSGCLCCVSDGDLKAALMSLVNQDSRVEHILVEASGLSSPGPMLGVLTRDGEFGLSGVFGVADATGFLQHERDFAAVRRQLAFADAVFLTKTDLCSVPEVDAVRERLAELRPGIKVLDSGQRLPWSALFAVEHTNGTEEVNTETRRRFFTGGSYHDAEVLEYETSAPLDPDRLRGLFDSLEPGILRAKGVLNLDHRSSAKYKYIVQYTGSQKQLYSRLWGDEPKKTSLVFLGSHFDAVALKERLDHCASGGTV